MVRWTLNTGRRRGSFSRLGARTTLRSGTTSVRLEHEFSEESISTERVIRSRRRVSAVVRFPMWGRGRVRLHSSRATEGQVLDVGGYRVQLDEVPADTRVSVRRVASQRSSPQTRRVVVLRFPVRRRGPTRVGHTIIVPETESPDAVASAAWAR